MQNAFLIKSYGLTVREVEVVNQIAEGHSNKVAADNLCVTEKTVKFHLTNIYRKIGVVSRSKLIVKLGVYAHQALENTVAPV
jgi:DNA-binding CsgD family transcriptional regulator